MSTPIFIFFCVILTYTSMVSFPKMNHQFFCFQTIGRPDGYNAIRPLHIHLLFGIFHCGNDHAGQCKQCDGVGQND